MNNTHSDSFPYFSSLSVRNVRCFGNLQELKLTAENGNPARWTTILGDNGTGKTTLLKCLAASYYVIPTFKATGSFLIPEANQRYFLRMNASLGSRVDFHFDFKKSLSDTIKKEDLTFNFSIDQNFIGRLGKAGEFENLKKYIFPDACFAYGAARVVDDSAIKKEQRESGVASLFDEKEKLMNPEEWLLQQDYLAKSQNGQSKINRDRVKEILLELFAGEISDIKIEHIEDIPNVLFQTDYGWVKLHDLSLGYKTLIAWMVDFASRMFRLYGKEEGNPLSKPAIVLVDEIDLHMHPRFQRKLYQFLTTTFPNTQFIVTAHSPLIVQATQDENIVLLKKEGDHVIINNDPESVRNWRIDQVLTSDLFGLESARPPETEKLLSERAMILSKTTLSEQDEKKLVEIESQIRDLPVGSTPEERQAFSIVDQIAAILKKEGK
ncbi:MAG: AAA family ATPase [Bacteroidia bacterium]|nr:AAA family ATPase [Bacteroidia bacterium]